MKAINFRHDFLRAIAFIVFTIFLVSCTSCCDEPVLKAVVTIQDAKNIGTTSATFVALVTANQDNTTVTFEYNSAIDATWKTIVLSEKYNGSVAKEVTYEVPGLQPGVQYNYRAKALNTAGETISSIKTFSTVGLTKSVVAISSVITKIDSATVVATVIANQDATSFSLEYKIKTSTTWQTKSWATNFSGNTLVTVNFDVAGLQANTDYDFRVKSLNVAGEVLSSVVTSGTYGAVDYDRNYYHTVTIGGKTWLKENLRTTHYANGDPIAHVTNLVTWGSLTTGAYCWYNNDPQIGKEYGALYNWYVGADPRGLIIGWHTPAYNEFSNLASSLGNVQTEYIGLKMMETGHLHWGETYGEATNSSGFTALANGAIDVSNKPNPVYLYLKDQATFWGIEAFGDAANWASISRDVPVFSLSGYNSKNYGFGLRLLK